MRVGILSTLHSPLLGYILREFIREEVPIDAVVLDTKCPDQKNKRIHEERTGGRLPPIPLQEFESECIPFYFVANHTSHTTAALVRELSLDLLVNGATPRILTSTTLDACNVGVVSCHPGLLPRFRGCTCVEWALYLDEPVGNTVYFMNEGIDEGPIILREELFFSKGDTYVDVRVKVYERGHALLAKGVKKVLAEGLTPATLPPQPAGSYFRVIEPDKMQVVLKKLPRGDCDCHK